jgi:FkbM family methyltransferase
MIRIKRRSGKPPRLAWLWHDLCLRLRQRLTEYFEITDGDARYRLRCGTSRELGRCYKFFLKEPGTCDWISKEVKPGDVFYDIGANIGVFTILAAKSTGEKGKVFAFEPHSANFTRLLDNIVLNGLQGIVVPCNFALNDEHGFFPFDYFSSETGTSNSQLSSVRSFSGGEYKPELSELKYAASVDGLIASGNSPSPHHIKIDVDGNELAILRGMTKLLRSPGRPRSVQVEISKRQEADILSFMETHNFVLSAKHYTRGAQRRIAKGAKPQDLYYNAIFRPVV